MEAVTNISLSDKIRFHFLITKMASDYSDISENLKALFQKAAV